MDAVLKILGLEYIDVPMIGLGTVLFFLFWKGCTKAIFAPLMKLHEVRESLTTGSTQSAEQKIQESNRISTEIEEKLQSVRISAMVKKTQAVNEARAEAQKILQKAEDESQEYLRNVRWDLMQKLSELMAEATKDADQMADLIVNRVLNPSEGSAEVLN